MSSDLNRDAANVAALAIATSAMKDPTATMAVDTPGSAGQPGEASYQTISAADIRTDTVPLTPTGFGSFPKAANTAGTFPDLGAGMWVLVEANGNALGLGTVDLGNGRTQGMNTPSCITFVSSQTPAYSGGANGRTIQYLHFSMGNWA